MVRTNIWMTHSYVFYRNSRNEISKTRERGGERETVIHIYCWHVCNHYTESLFKVVHEPLELKRICLNRITLAHHTVYYAIETQSSSNSREKTRKATSKETENFGSYRGSWEKTFKNTRLGRGYPLKNELTSRLRKNIGKTCYADKQYDIFFSSRVSIGVIKFRFV